MELNNTQMILVLLLALSSFPLSFSRVGQRQLDTQPEPEPPAEAPSMASPKVDPKLKDICKVTPEPDMCIQNYYFWTGEDHPDKNLTAQAVLRKNLEVGKKKSMDFYTKCISVSSEFYGKNHRVYTVFGNCARTFVLGANSLISAKTALIKEKDIPKTKTEIETAVNHYKSCESTFGDLQEAPKLEAEELYKITDVCTALVNNMP